MVLAALQMLPQELLGLRKQRARTARQARGSVLELGEAEVNLLTLKTAGLVGAIARVVKVVKTGEIKKAVKLNGIGATAGAKAAIEAAGGSVA